MISLHRPTNSFTNSLGSSTCQSNLPPSPSLPDESSSVGHDSVRVIFILSYVMNEGEDELHPRLDQHHISCRERGNKVRTEEKEVRKCERKQKGDK